MTDQLFKELVEDLYYQSNRLLSFLCKFKNPFYCFVIRWKGRDILAWRLSTNNIIGLLLLENGDIVVPRSGNFSLKPSVISDGNYLELRADMRAEKAMDWNQSAIGELGDIIIMLQGILGCIKEEPEIFKEEELKSKTDYNLNKKFTFVLLVSILIGIVVTILSYSRELFFWTSFASAVQFIIILCIWKK